MSIPLPLHESTRLEVLQRYAILDTPPEEAFDRITRIAARLFHVPIALVTLLDHERQWFKSCYGLDVAQTDRASALCNYTIAANEVLVVPDATRDDRFAVNPFVTGDAGVRFYAGAPLRTGDGFNIGTLCLIDLQPRDFSAEDCATLADLAAVVVDELEMRRMALELRESQIMLLDTARENTQLVVAIGSLPSGVTITDPSLPDNPIIFANAGFCATTGYSMDETIGYNCRFLQGPETDLTMVQKLREAIADRRAFHDVLLNYRKDGTIFQNELIMSPVFDEAGQLLSFVGLQNDVTEQVQAKELLEQRVQERTVELAQSQIEILQRLARAAEYRDDDTGQHTKRVANTASLLAGALGLPEEQVTLIREAAPLHDVGKIAISDLILLKPGKLTNEEFDLMRTHAAIGATMLSEGHSEVIQVAERIAGTHHERWDGRGYPERLSGEQIPLEGRILAVADVFDALTHERPYKKAWTAAEAVAEIVGQSGQQFDPHVVQAFLTLPHETLV